MHTLAILVKSYRDDRPYVSRLLKSYKRFNSDNIPLYLVVPEIDIPIFKKYTNHNISLLSDESIAKDLVNDSSVHGIRPGYINQEIIKLAFWEKRLCKNYFCMDSDGVFIRNFYVKDFIYQGDIPYTILTQDKELAVNPEYYHNHWVDRERLIRKIQKSIGLDDRRMLTSHGFSILSSRVLKSLHDNYLLPNKLTYKNLLEISPYEFSWYNMWLQKTKVIPIEFIEPLIKVFFQKSQHFDYLNNNIKIKDISRGYLGYAINSNYSRGYGILGYEDATKYEPSIKEIVVMFCDVIRYSLKKTKKITTIFKNIFNIDNK